MRGDSLSRLETESWKMKGYIHVRLRWGGVRPSKQTTELLSMRQRWSLRHHPPRMRVASYSEFYRPPLQVHRTSNSLL